MNDASPTVPRWTPIEITEEGARKLLFDLNPNKAAVPDILQASLQPQVLKELTDVLAPMVTLVFSGSKNQQKVSRDRKTANVAPIFKKGEKYKASNYCAISSPGFQDPVGFRVFWGANWSLRNNYHEQLPVSVSLVDRATLFTLTCVLCKCMEHIVASQIMRHLPRTSYTTTSMDSAADGGCVVAFNTVNHRAGHIIT